MVTITIPVFPLIMAVAILIAEIFMFTNEQFGILGGVAIITVAIFTFFLTYGFMAFGEVL